MSVGTTHEVRCVQRAYPRVLIRFWSVFTRMFLKMTHLRTARQEAATTADAEPAPATAEAGGKSVRQKRNINLHAPNPTERHVYCVGHIPTDVPRWAVVAAVAPAAASKNGRRRRLRRRCSRCGLG